MITKNPSLPARTAVSKLNSLLKPSQTSQVMSPGQDHIHRRKRGWFGRCGSLQHFNSYQCSLKAGESMPHSSLFGSTGLCFNKTDTVAWRVRVPSNPAARVDSTTTEYHWMRLGSMWHGQNVVPGEETLKLGHGSMGRSKGCVALGCFVMQVDPGTCRLLGCAPSTLTSGKNPIQHARGQTEPLRLPAGPSLLQAAQPSRGVGARDDKKGGVGGLQCPSRE